MSYCTAAILKHKTNPKTPGNYIIIIETIFKTETSAEPNDITDGLDHRKRHWKISRKETRYISFGKQAI